ncbi:MAG: stalk domain-containing protein [Bacillota bacterium]|nr:stalk domain-containing protein [Bacillota bacterium]
MLKKIIISVFILTLALTLAAKVEAREYKGIAISYPEAVLKVGQETPVPSVYLIDADGQLYQQEVTADNYAFLVSEPPFVKVGPTGQLLNIGRILEGRVITVFVVDKQRGLVGNTELWLDDAFAGFTTRVDKSYPEVRQEVNVHIALLEELISTVSDEAITVEVNQITNTNAPKLTIERYEYMVHELIANHSSSFKVTASQPGNAELNIIIVAESGSRYIQKLAIEFYPLQPPRIIRGAGEVMMFPGTKGYLRDGALVFSDYAPVIRAGRTFVPVGPLADSFQAQIHFAKQDNVTELVVLKRDDRVVTIPVGYSFIHIKFPNGKIRVIPLEAPIAAIDGMIMAPFRAIAEAFEAKVDFGLSEEGKVEWIRFVQ